MPGSVFPFPGQGAQAVGMGRQAAESNARARALFDRAKVILGYDLADVCFNGPAERLNSTVVSQPALYVASLAALELLKEQEPSAPAECKAAAGLSLGEYTALAFAGAVDFEAGLRVVRVRGEAMQAAADATPSGMVAVLGLELPQVEDLCNRARAGGTLQVANFLCPGNIVISGDKEACARAQALADEFGARTVPLTVAGAFHTPIMKPADEALAQVLGDIEIHPPRVPVWSNVDARPHSEPGEIRALLVRQVLQPVLWEQTMRNLLAEGHDRFYEIGPGRVLAGLLKRVQRKVDCRNIGG